MANKQVLTYSLRLPDGAQTDALRLLDASRSVVNQTISALWPRLTAFLDRPYHQAWKHVTDLVPAPAAHGNRQWRCEAETAGRILRAQAERQRLFTLIQPLLSDGLIIPATPTKAARKDRQALMTQIRALAQTEEATVMELVNVAEQAANVFLKTGRFPCTYDEMQPIPILKTGVLTYAGDDGMKAGQAYRLSIDVETATLSYRMRGPDATGTWRWPDAESMLSLPAPLVELLRMGIPLAPTLREVVDHGQPHYAVLDISVEVPTQPAPAWEQQDRVLGFDWGVRSLITTAVVTVRDEQEGRPFFLNTGGFDGCQARLRRQIDDLNGCRARLLALQEERPDHPHRALWTTKLAGYEQERALCWRKYARRNHELAHLSANILVFLAQIHDCSLICGEQLSSLRTMGRGIGVRGRWQHWLNNTTIRAQLQRILSYKAHRYGIRYRQEAPQHTSHTCPRCHQAAATYRSSHLHTETKAVVWGKWLICHNPLCAWNGARDYAAALNIARLGVAFLTRYHATKTFGHFTMTSDEVKPCRYTPQGAALRLPPHSLTAGPSLGTTLAYQGWAQSAHLRTAQPLSLLLVLCSAAVRKQVLTWTGNAHSTDSADFE